MNIKVISLIRLSLAVTTAFGLTSCGGGGGGGGISGAAFVNIDAEPRSVDAGDRIIVTIRLNEIHEGGIALKVRYPIALTFVTSSAEIVDDENDERGIVPDVQVSTTKDSFLVFYINSDDFGESGEGSVTFELQGQEAAEDAKIEVDPDVDDPLIDNTIEFNPDEPQFETEEEVDVTVEG
jgi:hypothetical protein